MRISNSFPIGSGMNRGLALVDAHLRCKTCHQKEQVVRRGEIIPACPSCEERTQWGLRK